LRRERVGGGAGAVVVRGRAMTEVLLVAQTEALAGWATTVLEAGAALEVTVVTRPSVPPASRPRAVVVVAEELAGPWFSAVVKLLRTRGWRRRTLVVAPLTGDNVEALRRTHLGPLSPPVGLDGEFAKAVARLGDGPRWEDRASARMQALLGVRGPRRPAYDDAPADPARGGHDTRRGRRGPGLDGGRGVGGRGPERVLTSHRVRIPEIATGFFRFCNGGRADRWALFQ